MDYFERLQYLLKIEKEWDRKEYELLISQVPVAERRASGLSWYPIAIRDTEMGRGDYLTVEVERTTHKDVLHQFRFGMPAAIFSNHDPGADRIEGVITHQSGDRIKISLRIDELPDWARDGKLGVDAVFDENSYREMEAALRLASALEGKTVEGRLVHILTGKKGPTFDNRIVHKPLPALNDSQNAAVAKILSANDLAVVHGPPGTGKTTTLVHAIKVMILQERQQVLVVAPSNAAVDLLSEKLSDEGLNVVRIGNPLRVSERLTKLTLDNRMAEHGSMKEIKRLKKQANEYRDLAHKYKRNFGRDEREQRKALFAEARNISRQVEATEQYITDDILARADVITATLIGANHYTIRNLKFETVVIDEAGQSLEPACWVPVLKAKKLVLAGDHCQLPPTVKSVDAARQGLGMTLLERLVALHPESVVLLEVQYRMHETIMRYPSQVFYENRLRADSSAASRLLAGEELAMNFVDTAGCGFEEKVDGTSISNPEEGAFLIRHLSRLASALLERYETVNLPDIAVISPYKHQVEVLKDLLEHAGLPQPILEKITVNTIDSFQGGERDIVYISMARSNAESNIGFLSDIRRMNVAMTRARKKLVVIGDSSTLSQLPFYADFIAYAEAQHSYVSAWEFADA